LLEEEERAKNTTLPEFSSEDEEDNITDSSDDGADGDRTSGAEEDSPKVDITG
jgi:hypothetical protein